MKTLKFLLIAAGSAGLLFLGACSSGSNQPSAPANSPAASSSPATSSSPSANHDADHKAGDGIVVESGAYHLELKPEKEGGETHLDLFVQKGDNHETIPTAKVTAQVQLPDGSQQTVPMNYDADGKHYTAKLSSTATGEYKLAVQSEIGSEKVNARYTFKL